jgi:hypothetical protein
MARTPEDLRASTKPKIRSPSRTSSSRPVRLALDMSETAGAAPKEDIVDSDDDLDVRAMAYPTVPPISEPNLTEGPSAYATSGELYPRQLSAPFLPNPESIRPLTTNLANGNPTLWTNQLLF